MYFGGCQPSASIFMAEYCSIPKTEAASSSETVIRIYQTTWLLIPKDTAVNPYCRENPDSYIMIGRKCTTQLYKQQCGEKRMYMAQCKATPKHTTQKANKCNMCFANHIFLFPRVTNRFILITLLQTSTAM